jgi:probable F420-dependent oxidoreductase
VDTSLSGSLAEAEAAAARAQRDGFDGLFTAEVRRDPFLPLARIARPDLGMDIGTGIAIAFARSPMTVAGTAWDLQEASGGRLILGIGSQVRAHIERRYSMPWSHPAARMREFVTALRAIWDAWQEGTRLDFDGDFYSHTLMTPMFDPGPIPVGPPRVYVAGVGRAMTEVAAGVGDGLFVHGFTTRRYLEEVTVPTVERALRRAGRSRRQFELKYAPFVVTGRDEDELERAAVPVRQQLAFYASTPAYRTVLDLHGWGELQPALHALARDGEWATMGTLIEPAMLEALAVVAPVDELAGGIGARTRGVVDRVSLVPLDGLGEEETAALVASLRAET